MKIFGYYIQGDNYGGLSLWRDRRINKYTTVSTRVCFLRGQRW